MKNQINPWTILSLRTWLFPTLAKSRGRVRSSSPSSGSRPLRGQNSVDGFQFLIAEFQVVQRSNYVVDLLRAAGSDQGRGHRRQTQHPGDCHLRQVLPSGLGDDVQLTDLGDPL